MRIVFLGSGAFGLPTLHHLARHHDLTGIITQPDRPAGRGGRLAPTPVGEWAAGALSGVPLLKPEKINLAEEVARVHALPADAWVVIAFGQKLGRTLLGDRFAINLHASLLPRWRGAAPINAAMLAGDATTGNSVITLADRMDAGQVLGQSQRPILPDMTVSELHDALAADGPALVERVLAERASGTLHAVTQDESQVTLAPKLSKSDGWVDFTAPPDECRRRINALSPWPGVAVQFRGEPLKLLRASPAVGGGHGGPGAVLDAADGVIACGSGALRIVEVQPAGKRAMTWRDFANGQRVKPQEVLTGGGGAC